MGNRILLVEDSKTSATYAKKALEKTNMQLIGIATNGIDALSIIDKEKPDLILMDIVLEGNIDGIDLTRIITTKFDIPVIYLSAYSDNEKVRRAMASNAFGYLIKPFHEKELLLAVEMTIKKHELERQIRISEIQLNTTLNAMGEGLIATDENNLIKFINKAGENIINKKLEDCCGKPLDTVFSLTGATPDDYINTSKLLNKSYSDFHLVLSDGIYLPLEITVSRLSYNGISDNGIVIVFKNIHERKKSESEKEKLINRLKNVVQELNTAYNRLDQTQNELIKMEQKNLALAMAVTANHEINQPLMVIKGNLDLLQLNIHKLPKEESEKYFQRMNTAISRIEAILKKLREIENPIFKEYTEKTIMVDLELTDF